MKKIYFIWFSICSLWYHTAQAQYQQTFEQSPGITDVVNHLRNQCWIINGFSVNQGSSAPISDLQSLVSGVSSNTTNRGINTAFLNFSGTDTISFQYKWYGNSIVFSRWFLIKLIDANGVTTQVDSIPINTNSNNTVNYQLPLQGINGRHRIYINYRGNGGLGRTGLDNFSFSGSYSYPTGCVDTDADGITDLKDKDNDNDGIQDVRDVCGTTATNFSCLGGTTSSFHPAGDLDADGVPNYQDAQFCALNTSGVCISMDFDADGIPDFFDLDSDNDGISDAIEAFSGIPPPNYLNGMINSPVGPNGMPNSAENATNSGITNFPVPDSDADGLADYIDIDADNDGIADNIEAQATLLFVPPLNINSDADLDGYQDPYDGINGPGATGLIPVNTDGADNPDYIDGDADNDGETDIIEGHDQNGNNIQDGAEQPFSSSGTDSDLDGMDENFDMAAGPDPDNGGQTPASFPENVPLNPEPDWRDAQLFTPEICNNGLDDDNDGFTDCDDPDCPLPVFDSIVLTGVSPCLDAINGTITIVAQQAMEFSIDSGLTFSPSSVFNSLPTGNYNLALRSAGGCVTFFQGNPVALSGNNCPPVAFDDFIVTSEDQAIIGNTVLGNDLATDGPGLTINTIPINGPTNGLVIIQTDGSFVYTPSLNFNGTDQFTYEICDNFLPVASCDTALVTITVNPVNDLPVIVNEVLITQMNISADTNILNNDFDVEGPLSVVIAPVSGPFSGTVNIDAAGNLTYTPALNFSGSDTVVFSVCDNDGTCINDTVFILVIPVNIPPVILNDTLITIEDTPFSGNLLNNDTDPDGTLLAVTVPVLQPQHGLLSVNSDGTFTYTPDLNYNGTDTAVVLVCDNGGACSNDTLFITVTPLNDLPDIFNDFFTTPFNTVLSASFLLNDSDIEGPLTANLPPLSGPSNGTFNSDAAGNFTYTPAPGFTGSDTVVVLVCDNEGGCSNDTLFISVQAGNQPPVVENEQFILPEDTPLGGNILNNDTDPDGTLSVNSIPVIQPIHGILSVNTDGTFTYTPGLNYNGNDTAVVLVCDNSGNCENDTLFLVVTPVNDTPSVNNEIFNVQTGNILNGNFLLNDSDVEGPLSNNTPQIFGPQNGFFFANTSGTFSYIPDNGFTGTDTVVMVVCDNEGLCLNDTLFIQVNLFNIPPFVLNDTLVINEDDPATSNILTNDVDPDGTLSVNTTPISGPQHGVIILQTNGDFIYTPNANYNGNDTVVVQVCDNGGICIADTLYILIVPLPDPVVINNENFFILPNVPFNGNILVNDSDPDGTLSVTTVPVIAPLNGTIIIDSLSGNFTYTPNAGFTGFDTIVVTVCSTGGFCGPDTLFIKVIAGNQLPIVNNESFNTPVNTPVSGNILLNDSDPDGPLFLNPNPISGPSNGNIVADSTGAFTYTPVALFTGTDTIVFAVCDTSGICLNDTLFVFVIQGNIPPVVLNEQITVLQDGSFNGNILVNDSDPDGILSSSTSALTGPFHGIFTINAAGDFTYTPNTGYIGQDTVVVSVCDNSGACGNDTIFIQIIPSNFPPVVLNDTLIGLEDQILVTNILLNDSDTQGPVSASTIILFGPMNGSANVNTNGDVTYTPNLNFNGTDTIVINVCDTGGICLPDTLFITILPVNDTLLVLNDTITTTENTAVNGSLVLNDSDPDNTTLNADISPLYGPLNGVIIININGSYTYLPNSGFTGTDTVVVTICDSGTPIPVICLSDTLIITVIAVNDAPIVTNDSVSTYEDTPVNGLVLTTDSDPEGTVLSASTVPVYGPLNGTITILTNGNFNYTPNSNFYGTDTVVISICDNGIPLPPVCVNDTLIITVLPVNDAPITINDTLVISQDTVFGGNLMGNDTDTDLTSLFTDTLNVSGPAHGTITMDSAGNYTYQPDSGYYGPDTVIVMICDSGFPLPSLCTADTLFITVTPVAAVANAGADQFICDSLFALPGNSTPVGSGLWQLISGTGIFADSSLYNTQVSGLSIGQNVFTWSISWINGTTTDTVVITVVSPPAAPDAGPDKTICSFNDSLSAAVPANGMGTWSVIGGSGIFGNINDPQTSINGMGIGANIFMWTVSNGICPPVTDTVVYMVSQLPSLAFAGNPMEVCGTNAVLNANVPVIGVGYWTRPVPVPQLTDSLSATSAVNGLTFGDNTLVWNILNGACPVSSDTIVITAYDNPSAANAGTDTLICGTEIGLQATPPLTGTGIWSSVGSATAEINDVFNATAKVINMTTGVYELLWTVTNGVCDAAKDTIKIEVQSCPDTTIFIPEGFSPNNDQVNDVLVIGGTNGKQVQIIVFNRWGTRVFESNNYQNDWGGDGLPDASYYYIIRIQGESKDRSGYFTIWK